MRLASHRLLHVSCAAFSLYRKSTHSRFDDEFPFVDESGILDRIANLNTFWRFSFHLETAPHAGPHSWIGYTMSDGLYSTDGK